MLSEEEKKAIEHLKDYLGDLDLAFNGIIITETAKDYKTILNLIEKQQKEIEELKDTRSIFNMGRRSYKNEIEDKIKAKIEECENNIKKIRHKKLINEPEDTIVITRYAHYISVLQSLFL